MAWVNVGDSVKDRVKHLLKISNKSRNSDDSLIANYWFRDMGKALSGLSAYGMLGLIAKGKLTNPESIRRCRQKLQEEYPELRGKTYRDRHNRKEEIKNQLGYGKS